MPWGDEAEPSINNVEYESFSISYPVQSNMLKARGPSIKDQYIKRP